MGKNVGKNVIKNISSKYSEKLIDHAKQSVSDLIKIASKRATDATGDLIGKTIP